MRLGYYVVKLTTNSLDLLFSIKVATTNFFLIKMILFVGQT